MAGMSILSQVVEIQDPFKIYLYFFHAMEVSIQYKIIK